MPRGDRTGPNGMGPMTGRAAGYCAGYPQPGFATAPGGGRGRGMGWGRGRGGGGWGRGQRNRFGYGGGNWGYPQAQWPAAAPPMPVVDEEQELEQLRAQAADFERTLLSLKKRIEELEGGGDKSGSQS